MIIKMKARNIIAIPATASILSLGFFGLASDQTVQPRVALQFASNDLTSPLSSNRDNAVIARLLLDTTGSTEEVRISSLPFNLVTGEGANAENPQKCHAFNETDLNNMLNTPSSATVGLSTGINNISLNKAAEVVYPYDSSFRTCLVLKYPKSDLEWF